MKKYKYLLPIFITLFFLQMSSCDEINSIEVNIPVTKEISASGSNSKITEEPVSFCLDEASDTYTEYKDKIKKLTFAQAAYRTVSVSDPSLKGDINLTVMDANGTTLFSLTIPNVILAAYMKPNSPFVIQLNQNQIQAIDLYLSNFTNQCFKAVLTVNNISGGTAPYSMTGAVDILLKADTEI
jgi:hypothetical protein